MDKKITLKGIVAAIDEVLKEIPLEAKSESYDHERTRKALKGIRETVEGLCVPGFDIPG